MKRSPRRVTPPKRWRAGRLLSWLALLLLAAIAGGEALLALFLHRPAWSHVAPVPLRALYARQYPLPPADPTMSVADAELGHRLKPGRHDVRTSEVAAAVDLNSRGLRDDEESLLAPEIVILGDSQAFGWGVPAQGTFADLLERATGKRVLNAAIPSYGTVRQRRLLSHLDTSRLRVVVVQYSDRAFAENAAFLDNRNTLAVPAPSRRRRGYLPGRHLLDMVELHRHPPAAPSSDDESQARVFLNALALGGSDFDRPGVRLIVAEVGSSAGNDDRFVHQVREQSHRLAGLPSWIAGLVAVDLSKVLRPADYSDLDEHLRPRGHAAVAAALAEAISGEGPGTRRYEVESAGAGHEPLLAGGDDAWAPARAISWGPPEYATTFRALWNEEGLFVLFDAIDPNPWHRLRKRDDPVFTEEAVEIFLDLDRSGTHYAEVEFSPAGVVCDFHVLRPLPEKEGEPPWHGDRAWNFEGVERRTWILRHGGQTQGWRVAAFLPWTGLRTLPSAARVALPPRRGDVWRFNVFRIERPHGPADPERDVVYAAWSPAPIPKFHVASAFRELAFR